MAIRCGVTFMPASRHRATSRSMRVARAASVSGADLRECLTDANYSLRRVYCQGTSLSREHERAARIVDQQRLDRPVVGALAPEARDDVDEQVVVAEAAPARQ